MQLDRYHSWCEPPTTLMMALHEQIVREQPSELGVICYETNLHTHGTMVRSTLRARYETAGAQVTVILGAEQPVLGFGTSLTDAAVLQLHKLDPERVRTLFYFLFAFCRMQFVRIPMGSCDFSWRSYSFLPNAPPASSDDEAQWVKANVRFAPEDEARITILMEIQRHYPHVGVIPTPWSAPPWMKTSHDYVGGSLKPTYFSLWARALVQYCQLLAARGVRVTALSVQNEPHQLPFLLRQTWETMFFTAEQLRDLSVLVAKYGGPPLLLGDDQRVHMPDLALPSFHALPPERVWAVGVHGYQWPGSGAKATKRLSSKHFANKPVVVSEFCTGFSRFLSFPLGADRSGTRHAAQYIRDVIHSLTVGQCAAYIDWNLLLDHEGGPNWAGNNVDSLCWVDDDARLHLGYASLLLAHVAMAGDQVKTVHTEEASSSLLAICRTDARNIYLTLFNDGWWGTQDVSVLVQGRWLADQLAHRCIKTYIFAKNYFSLCLFNFLVSLSLRSFSGLFVFDGVSFFVDKTAENKFCRVPLCTRFQLYKR